MKLTLVIIINIVLILIKKKTCVCKIQNYMNVLHFKQIETYFLIEKFNFVLMQARMCG